MKKQSIIFGSYLWFLSSPCPSWDMLNSALWITDYHCCVQGIQHCLVLTACEADQNLQTHTNINYFIFQLDFQCPMEWNIEQAQQAQSLLSQMPEKCLFVPQLWNWKFIHEKNPNLDLEVLVLYWNSEENN